uniref:Uncharacterized protein n=1 Tax=Chelydra serpentina TaxID=8475 RepID=A0A8C3RQS3_CHESE
MSYSPRRSTGPPPWWENTYQANNWNSIHGGLQLGGGGEDGCMWDSSPLLLLTSPQHQAWLISQFCQGNIGYFDNLEANSRNITNSVTFPTKASNQNFIVFLELKTGNTAVAHQSTSDSCMNKGCYFLAVLDHLYTTEMETHEKASLTFCLTILAHIY